MMNTEVDQIIYRDDGKVNGIRNGDQIADAPGIICDPTYSTAEQTTENGKIIRAICILDHPIPDTQEAQSLQIVMPAKQIKRQNDIYITMASNQHSICKKGYYVAVISTRVETEHPNDEIKCALNLLGDIKEMFIDVATIYETKKEENLKQNMWVTSSYDTANHLEEVADEILTIYQEVTGQEIDLS